MKELIACLPTALWKLLLSSVPVLLLCMCQTTRADTSLTITVTNIPANWGTAHGDSLAIIGTMNGWSVTDTATVDNQTISFTFPSISLSPLGDDWIDKPDSANIGFRFVDPNEPATTRIKADFRSNDGNFRLALQPDTANTIEINAGPVATLIDQASAVSVNGVLEHDYACIDRQRFAFPGGRWKALVMSYDDGHDQDRGLIPIFNQFGIKGTFHLNSGWLDTDTFISSTDVQTIYAPHEVSVHTVDHPDLTYVDDETVRWEVGHCRWVLSELAGYDTCSMSYPMGGYDKRVLSLLPGQGITCSRTVENTFSLDYMPVDPLKWHPTCHHVNADGFVEDFINRTDEQLTLLFIWGHSYELDYGQHNNSWAYMTWLCQALGHRGDTWYAGMEEVRAYLATIQALEYPADGVIHNPSSDITVWARPDTRMIRIRPGRTVLLQPGQTLTSPALPYENSTITLRYDPGSNALSHADNVFIHIGHDGWQNVQQIAMTQQANGTFTCPYSIPTNTATLEWAFFDGDSVWDDNGGSDWTLAVRPAATGTVASVNITRGSPIVLSPSDIDQNAIGEFIDLNTNGQSATSILQGGFGAFGNVYLNYDNDYLYLGGTGLDRGGSNNAVILFLQLSTLPNPASNLWNFSGTPYGLDHLHNVIFEPAVNLAIILGDEYGDGSFLHFNLESGYDFGQGVYYLNAAEGRFIPVPGIRLAQFDGAAGTPTATTDDDGNGSTDRWEVAIPWSSLNAPMGVHSVRSCHLSGLIASDGISGDDRYLSANGLGELAEGDFDAYGNYGLNLVTLSGQRVGLVDADSDLDGMPDVWESVHGFNPASHQDATLDTDGDGYSNRQEYIADTDPASSLDYFDIATASLSNGVSLVIDCTDRRIYTLEHTDSIYTPHWTAVDEQIGIVGSSSGILQLTVPTQHPYQYYRIRVSVP